MGPEGLSKKGEEMQRFERDRGYEAGDDAKEEVARAMQQLQEGGYAEINLSHFSPNGRAIVEAEVGRLDAQKFQIERHEQPRPGADEDLPAEQVISIQKIK